MKQEVKENIRISFLIPTLGERETELRRLLQSIREQSVIEGVEAVIVAQDNYDLVKRIAKEYQNAYSITVVELEEKGLSKARNRGLEVMQGDIVVLSDDDCWYQEDAAAFILSEFETPELDILLSQIKDYDQDVLYKKYAKQEEIISSKWKLLKCSSIEIAYRRERADLQFDELFGVGAEFVAGEEVDFLLRAYKNVGKIKYVPKVTVYHAKKQRGYSSKAHEARGALYAKNFNRVIGFMICCRDLLIRRQNVFKDFFRGYDEYAKRKN